MKTALEILASLSPVQRNLDINPYTADEVRRIAKDEMLTTFDRGTLYVYADTLGKPKWWEASHVSDPDDTPERRDVKMASAAIPPWVNNWLHEADLARDASEQAAKRVTALRVKLAGEIQKMQDADETVKRFTGLYRAAPETQALNAAYNKYWVVRNALRKPVPPVEGK